jgi:hypothetical protein
MFIARDRQKKIGIQYTSITGLHLSLLYSYSFFLSISYSCIKLNSVVFLATEVNGKMAPSFVKKSLQMLYLITSSNLSPFIDHIKIEISPITMSFCTEDKRKRK